MAHFVLNSLNKKVAGIFDFDMLANEFDPRDLVAFGFSEDDLGLGDLNAQEDSGDAVESESDDDRVIKCPKCKH